MVGISIEVVTAETQHGNANERHESEHRHAERIEVETNTGPAKSQGWRDEAPADDDDACEDKGCKEPDEPDRKGR